MKRKRLYVSGGLLGLAIVVAASGISMSMARARSLGDGLRKRRATGDQRVFLYEVEYVNRPALIAVPVGGLLCVASVVCAALYWRDRRQEERALNKPSLPTPDGVMPTADAQGAPPIGEAHL